EDTGWFATESSLELSTGVMTATSTSKSATLTLSDVTVSTGSSLVVWFSVLPTAALDGKPMAVKAYSESETFIGTISAMTAFEAGKAYSFDAAMSAFHEYVDLGLPQKWATCNVGASSPLEVGGYYAWAEIETKDSYTNSNYKYGTFPIKKYNSNGDFGTVDNLMELEAMDDVATVKWGPEWHVPTKSDWEDLFYGCTWEWTTIDGVNGCKVTGKGDYSENWIFLPAGGYFDLSNQPNVGASCNYWSASLHSASDPIPADYLLVTPEERMFAYAQRRTGRNIRPVKK
ncbi:MAG: hypothetical protein ACI4TJ_01350, partial [Candidatus Cryptobacteroides sp.]